MFFDDNTANFLQEKEGNQPHYQKMWITNDASVLIPKVD